MNINLTVDGREFAFVVESDFPVALPKSKGLDCVEIPLSRVPNAEAWAYLLEYGVRQTIADSAAGKTGADARTAMLKKADSLFAGKLVRDAGPVRALAKTLAEARHAKDGITEPFEAWFARHMPAFLTAAKTVIKARADAERAAMEAVSTATL